MEDMERSLAEAMELGNSLYLENDADADSALHKIQRLNRGIEWAKKLAEQQKQKIELFVATISDSETRRIFRYRYIDGTVMPSWQWIAFKMGGGNSADAVRMTHNRFLKKI